MTPIIQESQATKSTTEGRYSIEASVARFPIGRWPTNIIFMNKTLTMQHTESCEGDIEYVKYASSDGKLVMTVFND